MQQTTVSAPERVLPPGMGAGVAAGLAAGALWGTTFVAPLVAPGFSSVDYTAGRFIACGLFALLWMLWQTGRTSPALRRHLWPTAEQARAALGLSVLGYTGYYLLLVYGIADAGAAVPALIIGTLPLWMMLLGKPDRMRWSALGPGLVLTAGGMALMLAVSADQVQFDGHGNFWRGVLLATAAMLSWLAFGLLNARWLRTHTQVRSTAWANWLGLAAGLGGLGLWLLWGTPMAELVSRPGFGRFLLVCTFTGIGSAWVAAVLWNVASRRLSPSLAGQLVVSETVFALLYAFAWSGAWPAPAQFLACLLFVGGILASIRAHR
ncbi:DMT family transporter [Hydrogenophaga sp.]|uniref:DMT family transporter n=1 Tax=Hydrogenophaga sp. TaxID=1904254 RepID=UPI002D1FBD28|nr:DMT family transporter [Hydrogenophaga sp.]